MKIGTLRERSDRLSGPLQVDLDQLGKSGQRPLPPASDKIADIVGGPFSAVSGLLAIGVGVAS